MSGARALKSFSGHSSAKQFTEMRQSVAAAENRKREEGSHRAGKRLRRPALAPREKPAPFTEFILSEPSTRVDVHVLSALFAKPRFSEKQLAQTMGALHSILGVLFTTTKKPPKNVLRTTGSQSIV